MGRKTSYICKFDKEKEDQEENPWVKRCLKCDGYFEAKSKYNRICHNCKMSNRDIYEDWTDN